MRFGLLSYGTANLGDEIQSIAAARFLPRIDTFLDRDRLDLDPGGDAPVHLILNGWFLRPPICWPPHPRIKPLLISMHLDMERLSKRFWWRPAGAHLLKRAGRDWFCAHGPVGARDTATCDLLNQHGVQSYPSGCLTLTLPPSQAAREDVVVACDLAEPVLAALHARAASHVVAVSHYTQPYPDPEGRMAKARALLDLYGRAKAVITSRLHCALPCLALGTPVLLITDGEQKDRMQPGLDLARTSTSAAFLAGRDEFDVDNPPANPQAWQALAPELVRRCEAFIAAATRDRTED